MSIMSTLSTSLFEKLDPFVQPGGERDSLTVTWHFRESNIHIHYELLAARLIYELSKARAGKFYGLPGYQRD